MRHEVCFDAVVCTLIKEGRCTVMISFNLFKVSSESLERQLTCKCS